MKVFKKIFPSRNYITIDTFGDCEIIFNPVGEGFEGEDSLKFRRGRWAFRVNDFLSGKVLPNGEKEGMNRKTYSLGVVYDSEDGEPLVSTTYVDPTSVIPLDGSLVTINGIEGVQITNESLGVLVKNRQFEHRIPVEIVQSTELKTEGEVEALPLRYNNQLVFNGTEPRVALGYNTSAPSVAQLRKYIGGTFITNGGQYTDEWSVCGTVGGNISSGWDWSHVTFALVGRHTVIVASNVNLTSSAEIPVSIGRDGENYKNVVLQSFIGAAL